LAKKKEEQRKPIKAILIDVGKKTIREITLERGGEYRPEMFEVLSVPGLRPVDDINVIRLDNEIHYLHVDGESLFKDPKLWFHWKGYGNPLAGNGIIHRVDEMGDSRDVRLTVQQVAAHVTFDTLQMHGFIQHVGAGTAFGKPATIITNRAVITRPGEGVDRALQEIADELGIPVESIKWTKVGEELDPAEQEGSGDGTE
jgi:hypothetical protein